MSRGAPPPSSRALLEGLATDATAVLLALEERELLLEEGSGEDWPEVEYILLNLAMASERDGRRPRRRPARGGKDV